MPYSVTDEKGVRYAMDKLDFNGIRYNFNGMYRSNDLTIATSTSISEIQSGVLQTASGRKRTRSKQLKITNQPNFK